MDNVLQSLEQSPLFQSLAQGSSYQDFIYKLQDSLGSLSKNRVEIPFSSIDANTAVNFDLPEYGLVYNMFLRITVRNSATTPGNALMCDTGYFANLFERITLLSNSREIEQLTPLSLLDHVLSQPEGKKQLLKRLTDYAPKPIGGKSAVDTRPDQWDYAKLTDTLGMTAGEDTGDITNEARNHVLYKLITEMHKYIQQAIEHNNTIVQKSARSQAENILNAVEFPEYRYVYVPPPFKFFQGSGWKSAKDLSFLERLTISCQFGRLFNNSNADAIGGGLDTTLMRPRNGTTYNSSDTTPVIVKDKIVQGNKTILGSALVVNYLNLPNDALRTYQQAQFSIKNNKN